MFFKLASETHRSNVSIKYADKLHMRFEPYFALIFPANYKNWLSSSNKNSLIKSLSLGIQRLQIPYSMRC